MTRPRPLLYAVSEILVWVLDERSQMKRRIRDLVADRDFAWTVVAERDREVEWLDTHCPSDARSLDGIFDQDAG